MGCWWLSDNSTHLYLATMLAPPAPSSAIFGHKVNKGVGQCPYMGLPLHAAAGRKQQSPEQEVRAGWLDKGGCCFPSSPEQAYLPPPASKG